MIDKNKLLIIIPAYNEQDSILHTIKELKASSAKDLAYIVINDGSKDDTLKVLQDKTAGYTTTVFTFDKFPSQLLSHQSSPSIITEEEKQQIKDIIG